MNAQTTQDDIGMLHQGGFFAGKINIGGHTYALIVAPKAEGEREDVQYNAEYVNEITGAKSFNDGLTNTNAMADAGSDLAKWARGLQIGGFDDWYIPSQDELEVIYRNLKPTSNANSFYMRSGINASAVPPTHPYTKSEPARTFAAAFQDGGEEAFANMYYWTSTQHAAYSGDAWSQSFDNGFQLSYLTYYQLRARAVRRVLIEEKLIDQAMREGE